MTVTAEPKPLRINDVAPDFKADSTQGRIEFYRWAAQDWTVFFSHPKDFTPVCTTELGEVAKRHREWEDRRAKVLALSVDAIEDHKRWIADIEETQGCSLDFPILGGPSAREVALLYGMIHPSASDTFTVRSVFFIDPSRKIRATLAYPAPTGRNFEEVLRVLDALQLTDRAAVATPANWREGSDCIVLPSLSDEEAKKRFPKGFITLRPYLRVTPQP